MPLNATQLQARIDTIRSARDSGVSRVEHGDTVTQWRSLDEVERIIANLQAELDRLNGVKRKRVHYVVQRSKGFRAC